MKLLTKLKFEISSDTGLIVWQTSDVPDKNAEVFHSLNYFFDHMLSDCNWVKNKNFFQTGQLNAPLRLYHIQCHEPKEINRLLDDLIQILPKDFKQNKILILSKDMSPLMIKHLMKILPEHSISAIPSGPV